MIILSIASVLVALVVGGAAIRIAEIWAADRTAQREFLHSESKGLRSLQQSIADKVATSEAGYGIDPDGNFTRG